MKCESCGGEPAPGMTEPDHFCVCGHETVSHMDHGACTYDPGGAPCPCPRFHHEGEETPEFVDPMGRPAAAPEPGWKHRLIEGTQRPELVRAAAADPSWLPHQDLVCICGAYYMDHRPANRRALLRRALQSRRGREWWRDLETGAIIGVELQGDRPVRATPPVPPLVVAPFILYGDTLNWQTLTPERVDAIVKRAREGPGYGVLEETPESRSMQRLYGVLRRALSPKVSA